MSVSARVRALIEPLVAAEGLELFDLEQVGPVLRVTVDRQGGVSIDDITKTTRAISRAIDEHDPISSSFTLEVSSPGLERVLRTPAHYAWAVGRTVAVKTFPNHPVGRRFAGTVTGSSDTTVTIALDEPLWGRASRSTLAKSKRRAPHSSGVPHPNRAALRTARKP
jgi:ribosome maturation factor RimP